MRHAPSQFPFFGKTGSKGRSPFTHKIISRQSRAMILFIVLGGYRPTSPH